jgi:hypothetical protein
MIASWRGLAIVTAIAVALVIAVVVDLGRSSRVVDRALVPGFDPERVTELVWERAGQPALRVVRTGDGWEFRAGAVEPPPAQESQLRADPAAIGEVLAALRGARWHRRGEPTPVHTTLSLVASDGRRVLGIGDPLAGADQTWIVSGDRGLVVDRWVPRALDRDRLSLSIKRPLGDIRASDAIALEGQGDEVAGENPAGLAGEAGGKAPRGFHGRAPLRVIGRPRQLATALHLVLAADVVDQLERALAEIEIVRLLDGPSGAAGLAITAERGARRTSVVVGGACPGAPALVAISGPQGDGCIERAAAQTVEHAAARLQQPAGAIAERRPVPISPDHVVLSDGVALDIASRRVGGVAADPARIAELVAALAAPAEVVALPTGPAAQHLVVTGRAGVAFTLDVFAERVVARRGEPIALRPGPAAWQALVRPSRELRDAALWLEEPTMISELEIDGVRYVRGQVIGDWTRRPPGAADAHSIEALVGLLAQLRSSATTGPQIAVIHRVAITVAPPAGAASQHVLELGAPRAAGCPARVGNDAVMLPAIVCVLVAALAP